MSVLWQCQAMLVPGRGGPRLRIEQLAVNAGVTAIVGPSGAGKSSLVQLLVGYLPATWQQQPARSAWAAGGHGLWDQLSVREHCSLVGSDADLVERALEMTELRSLAQARPPSLSAGERSRLDCARALASGAEVVVLDEAMAHLDGGRAERVWAAVHAELLSTGRSLVYTTHRPEEVLGWADHLLCLEHGEILFAGALEDGYRHPPSEAVARCLGPVDWLDAEALQWYQIHDERPCLRPDDLHLAVAADGPLAVVTSRFHGSHTATELQGEGQAVRRVLHRGAALVAGQRVHLHVLAMLLLLVAGCGGNDPASSSPLQASRSWQLSAQGAQLPAPRAVAALAAGGYVVLDTVGRLVVFDQAGVERAAWSMPETEVGRPEGLVELADGRLAVADTHYHRVVIFAKDGSSWDSFGSKGHGPGQFIYPVGVAVDDAGLLYVSEYGGNDRIQVFTSDGELVRSFGTFGDGPGAFQRPAGVAWYQGLVYVADAHNNRVQVFSDQGVLQEQLQQAFGPDLGLHFPYDVCVDADGRVYVVEYGGNRVTVTDSTGAVLARLGSGGRGRDQIVTPWGMTVAADGEVLVADTGNRRMVAWRW
ncbi:MAG: ATP-binding cassette domain-containing protein [Planctomycetota bacterium]|jgi:iron(III) transport system ATP-binding protein|nr:ATP-binding cassette domain-containing protein [Planctomycetota bacterium]